MSYETIALERDGRVAILTLNRPQAMNSLNPDMLADLEGALAELGRDSGTSVVVMTGAGRAFSAGGDVKFFARRIAEQEPAYVTRAYLRRVQEVMRGFTTLDKPTIAAVNGAAVGGGMNFALACDIRIAAEGARFGEAFINVGLGIDMGGGWLLPRIVGVSKACEIIFTGDTIDAREAERIGLVSKVVPAAELMPAAMGLAKKIASKAPMGLAMSKAIIYKGLQTDFATSLEHESECATLSVRTEDHKEAVAAFIEKREAVFKGR